MAEKNTKKIEEKTRKEGKFSWDNFDKEKFFKETDAIKDIFINKEKEKYGKDVCGCGGSV
ncbi:MAG: hypothetical protein WCX69_02485 [Candidatus Paceibacterota bacterium]